MTLSIESLKTWSERLDRAATRIAEANPGEGPERQPVHTVYGGAHLFSANTAERLGELSLRSVGQWLPEPTDLAEVTGMSSDLATKVHPLVIEKLEREPVEDFRIDFEDGYGHRSDDEEDGHARSTAVEVAMAMSSESLPPFIGIRVKSLSGELYSWEWLPSRWS
jgi:hypothetical protein